MEKKACGCGVSADSIERKAWTDGCTDRINKLRDAYWKHAPEVDIERAVSYTRSYKQTEGKEMIVRKAQAMYDYFAEKTIKIHPNELIAGTYGKAPRAAVCCPDISWRWFAEELDTIDTRPQDPYQIQEEDKKVLREEMFPYWDGKAIQDVSYANISDELKKFITETGIISCVHTETGVGEFVPDYGGKLMKEGFRGLEKEVREKLAEIDPYDQFSYNKQKFYEAMLICCETAKLQSERYVKEAERMAAETTDAEEKEHLLKIAERCKRVPYDPPRDFAEAVQFVWLSQILMWTEENGTSICIERPDQYLYPFYRTDLAEGRITELEAQELIEALYIKMAEIIYFISSGSAEFYAGYQTFHGLTLSGCDMDGNDATNELSYMFLQACMDLRMHSPTLNVRVTENCPEEFLDKVMDLVKLGTGQPAIYFDETARKLMQNMGACYDDAKTWCIGGCVEPQIPGKTHRWTEGGRYSYANAVEWVLLNGYSKPYDYDFGVKTGDPRTFKDFEEFKDAVKEQLKVIIQRVTTLAKTAERAHLLYAPKPMQSLVTQGCIESGKDTMNSGAIYNCGPGLETTGIADLADSLMAIKKFVYDDKVITMDELIHAVETDFAEDESLRMRLKNGAPKYGNDEDEVDLILKEFVDFSVDETVKYININGRPFANGLVPVSANVPHGKAVWALPSGRKALDTLADGASPYNGCDVKGPTAVIKSLCKMDPTRSTCGTLLNMKIAPQLLDKPADREKFKALLKAEAALGGYHIQFNVVNNEVLRDAQIHPQDHTDLLVRVAGYSAFFIDLHVDTQNSIIGRTENKSW